MMTLMMCSAIMMQIMSPIKMAFSITMASIMVSMMAYWPTSSVYPSCGVVISFSSGMMILFCYCAMMNTHEKTPSKKKTMLTGLMMTIILFSMENQTMMESNTSKMKMVTPLSTMPMAAMGVIILTMFCINKSMFSPSKSLSFSY